jgi:anti-anti-sigma factor
LHESPDPALPLDDRPVGGWGIYFMRKLMDSVDYRYVNNKNHLILRKIREQQPAPVMSPATGLTIQKEELEKGYWRIALKGRLDSKTSPSLDSALRKEFEINLLPRLVIDMDGVEYVSSSGLKVLVSAWRQAREKHGDVLLTSLQPRTREVFEMIGFDMMFKIYPTPADAIADDPIGTA